MRSYKDLEVWQVAMQLVEEVYSRVGKLPAEERFALASQMRRAAISVPSNIAEGSGRETTKDFLHFLVQARGSLFELKTQLDVCQRLKYVEDVSREQTTADRVGMMLNALVTSLKSKMARATNESRATNHEPRQ